MLAQRWPYALALALGVLAGWYMHRAPAPAEHVVYKDRVVERVVQAAAKTEVRVVYRDRVIKPDGTITEHETERSDTKEATKLVTDHTETKAADRTVTPAPEARWHIAAIAGYGYQGPLVGAAADYRLIGPFTVGLWAHSTTNKFEPAGGVSLGVTF